MAWYEPLFRDAKPPVMLVPTSLTEGQQNALERRGVHFFQEGRKTFDEWFRDLLDRQLLSSAAGDLQRQAICLPIRTAAPETILLLNDFNLSAILSYSDLPWRRFMRAPREQIGELLESLTHVILRDDAVLYEDGLRALCTPDALVGEFGKWAEAYRVFKTPTEQQLGPVVNDECGAVAASLGLSVPLVSESYAQLLASAPPTGESSEEEETVPIPRSRVWLVQSSASAGAQRSFVSVCQSEAEATALATCIENYAKARRQLCEQHGVSGADLALIGEEAKIQSFELE